MGDRPPPRCSSGLRLLLRLAAVVSALLVLCVSTRASAAIAVPMCGEHGESIAAPPIFRAHDPGSLIATPCHYDALEFGRVAPIAPERVLLQQRPERVLAFGTLSVAQSTSSRVSIATVSTELDRPGFAESLFRPPRA